MISDRGKYVEQLNMSLVLAGNFLTMTFNQSIRALQWNYLCIRGSFKCSSKNKFDDYDY